MDAIAFSAPKPNPTPFPSSSKPSSRAQLFSVCSARRRRRPLGALRSQSSAAASASHHDVVIVGAGIVGLSIARHLLLHTPLSVAITDAAFPCSGATGAGQGYIWMSHRTPGSDTWELAVRSKQLWEELAAKVDDLGGGGARERLGWMKTGSLLVGRTSEELATLEEMTKVLSQAGIHAECLSAPSLHALEPALYVGNDGGAMFLPEDCQIDAFQAVSLIEKINGSYSPEGRYMELYNDPAMSLIRSEVTGTVEAVQTSKNILYGRKAIVIASGAWSRSVLHSFLQPNSTLDIPVKPRKSSPSRRLGDKSPAKERLEPTTRLAPPPPPDLPSPPSDPLLPNLPPLLPDLPPPPPDLPPLSPDPAIAAMGAKARGRRRRRGGEARGEMRGRRRAGHLLVLDKFDKLKLNHGLMELGYVDHQVAKSNSTALSSESDEDENGASSISMTATLNTKGNLVLGSSREFKGFSREVDKSILKYIWDRAGEFFPVLKNVHFDINQNTEIRIGHRPYMPDGKPVIGFVPDLPNVLIATGHEGSGLALALGTAEMVTDMILGNPGKVDFSPFSIGDRFSG